MLTISTGVPVCETTTVLGLAARTRETSSLVRPGRLNKEGSEVSGRHPEKMPIDLPHVLAIVTLGLVFASQTNDEDDGWRGAASEVSPALRCKTG